MCAEQLKGSLPKGVFAVNITSLQLISTEFFIGNFYPSDHCLASEKTKEITEKLWKVPKRKFTVDKVNRTGYLWNREKLEKALFNSVMVDVFKPFKLTFHLGSQSWKMSAVIKKKRIEGQWQLNNKIFRFSIPKTRMAWKYSNFTARGTLNRKSIAQISFSNRIICRHL